MWIYEFVISTWTFSDCTQRSCLNCINSCLTIHEQVETNMVAPYKICKTWLVRITLMKHCMMKSLLILSVCCEHRAKLEKDTNGGPVAEVIRIDKSLMDMSLKSNKCHSHWHIAIKSIHIMHVERGLWHLHILIRGLQFIIYFLQKAKIKNRKELAVSTSKTWACSGCGKNVNKKMDKSVEFENLPSIGRY